MPTPCPYAQSLLFLHALVAVGLALLALAAHTQICRFPGLRSSVETTISIIAPLCTSHSKDRAAAACACCTATVVVVTLGSGYLVLVSPQL